MNKKTCDYPQADCLFATDITALRVENAKFRAELERLREECLLAYLDVHRARRFLQELDTKRADDVLDQLEDKLASRRAAESIPTGGVVIPGSGQQTLSSAARFVVGQVLTLRPEHGGGRWRVVELLPQHGMFHQALAVRVRGTPDE